MSLFSTIKRFATNIAQEYGRAHKSFSSAVSEITKYVPYTPSWRERKIHEESEYYQAARDAGKQRDIKKHADDNKRYRTISNLKKNYQYLFNANITFENGMSRVSPSVSVLSDTKLTVEQAEILMIANLYEHESKYGSRIENIQNVEFIAERRNVTFP